MLSTIKPTTDYERELEEQLIKFGTLLQSPPSSNDKLLTLLQKMEQLLTMVDQQPPKSIQDALFPSRKALVMTELLRNAEKDVQFSVVYCIHEIARITASDLPYEDELMKEIFELTVAAFGALSDVSSRGYTRAAAVLDTVARYKTCLVMLDLELDELVVDMFDLFLKSIRSEHPNLVFLAMKTVMTSVIEDVEEISLGLLSPLLHSVKRNKVASPLSRKLGEEVIANCAAKLKPYLMEAVTMGIALDDFSEIIASICQNRYDTQDYDLVKESAIQLPCKRKSEDKRTKESPGGSSNPKNRVHQGIPHKRGRPKKSRSTMNENAGPKFAKVPNQCPLDDSLVRRRIKVWWPLDSTFYDGIVDSFDPIQMRHKVLYDDGEQETLNLKEEHWELIGD